MYKLQDKYDMTNTQKVFWVHLVSSFHTNMWHSLEFNHNGHRTVLPLKAEDTQDIFDMLRIQAGHIFLAETLWVNLTVSQFINPFSNWSLPLLLTAISAKKCSFVLNFSCYLALCMLFCILCDSIMFYSVLF